MPLPVREAACAWYGIEQRPRRARGGCDLSEAALMPRLLPRWRVARSASCCTCSGNSGCRAPLASPGVQRRYCPARGRRFTLGLSGGMCRGRSLHAPRRREDRGDENVGSCAIRDGTPKPISLAARAARSAITPDWTSSQGPPMPKRYPAGTHPRNCATTSPVISSRPCDRRGG
jgi:hypothetical protein